jgi:hypothetical protein
MKGIVFTELIDMIEQRHGLEVIDNLLSNDKLESKGVFTSVGTYKHTDLLMIADDYAKLLNTSTEDVIKEYGRHLFGRFNELLPQLFEGLNNSFAFLEKVHDFIHVEVKKVYPDASLPSLKTSKKDDNTLIVEYQSHCPLAYFAEGLILGCIDFFEENISVSTTPGTNDLHSKTFILNKND